jgi:hypothetical protein
MKKCLYCVILNFKITAILQLNFQDLSKLIVDLRFLEQKRYALQHHYILRVFNDLQKTMLSRRNMIWLLPRHLLTSYNPPSVISTGDTKEYLLTGEGGGEKGWRNQVMRRQESLGGHLKIIGQLFLKKF